MKKSGNVLETLFNIIKLIFVLGVFAVGGAAISFQYDEYKKDQAKEKIEKAKEVKRYDEKCAKILAQSPPPIFNCEQWMKANLNRGDGTLADGGFADGSNDIYHPHATCASEDTARNYRANQLEQNKEACRNGNEPSY